MNIRAKFLCALLKIGIVVSLCLVRADRLYGYQDEYELAAGNFLKFIHSSKEIISNELIESNDLSPSLTKIPVAYLANLEGGGYVLVSASEGLTPIKAYSLKDNFETLPGEYRTYLLSELEYRVRIYNDQEKILQRSKASDDSVNRERWAFLLNFQDQETTRYKYEANTILLKTKWNQKHPYNKLLPQINGQPVQVGCTNVAIAQVMKYYNYPPSGEGIVSYTWNGQNLKAVFSKNYHWENMPDSINPLTPGYQQDEVARLMRDIAIAHHTEFGVSASSASANRDVLVNIFGFANEIKMMDNSSESLFFATLRNEISALRPVLLKFPGHMTVADGYSSNSVGREIHVNFGWGDHSDGYYFLDETVVADTYPTPFTTNLGDLEMCYNIKPCSGGDCDTNRESEDNIQGITISGRFNTEYDSDEYKVYLKGSTSINGYRNLSSYQNRAFIISIFDLGKNLKACNKGTESILVPAISTNLAAGKYIIKISPCDELGACYGYEPFVYYTTTVTTQALTSSEKEAANNYDPAPVINNDFKDIIINSSDGPHRILIDATDESGDVVSLSAASTHRDIGASIDENDVLVITPKAGLTRAAAKVTVTASSDGKSTGKSFIVLVINETIFFGKEFEIFGLFSDQNTFNKHKVILEGSCTVTGDNGYTNQGFYTSIMDMNGTYLVNPIDKKIENDLGENYYFIGASLRQNPQTGSGSYYVYHYGEGDIYSLKVCCPEANDDTAYIATQLDISLSGTGMKNPPILSLNADKDCGVAPLEVMFGIDARDNDGTISSYQWHFGDGKTSTQREPIHIFSGVGDYIVSCTIKDNDGLSANNTFSVRVNQDRIKITDLQGLPLNGGLASGLGEGRNAVLLYNTSCSSYNSYDFLLQCKGGGQMVNLHSLDRQSCLVNSAYWFFDQVSGQEIDLPEETEFSDVVPQAPNPRNFIDLVQ